MVLSFKFSSSSLSILLRQKRKHTQMLYSDYKAGIIFHVTLIYYLYKQHNSYGKFNLIYIQYKRSLKKVSSSHSGIRWDCIGTGAVSDWFTMNQSRQYDNVQHVLVNNMPLCTQDLSLHVKLPSAQWRVKLEQQVKLLREHKGCVTVNVLSRNSGLRLNNVTEKKIFPSQYFESRWCKVWG